MSETAVEPKLRTITPEMLGTFTETVEIDANANAFQRPTPLPDGLYTALATLPAKTGQNDRVPLQGGTDKNGHGYFFGNFDVKVTGIADAALSPEVLKGRAKTFRGRVNTFAKTDTKTGGETSEMATFCNTAGAQIGGSVQIGQLGYAFLQVLQANAPIGVKLQWQAGHMIDEKGKDGKTYKTWKVVRRGMTTFPKNDDGSYNPTITFDGEELTARAEVVEYFRLS